MDFVTKYGYFLGNALSLAGGSFDEMQPVESLDNLNSVIQGGIIIPKFVGVYQSSDIVLEGSEKDRADEIRARAEIKNSLIKEMSKTIIEIKCDERESFCPELMHIIYNPNIFPDESLVRVSFGSIPTRIRVSPCNKAPNFYDKDTSLISRCVDKVEFDQDYRKKGAVADAVLALRKQMETFGLTREEYSFLVIAGEPEKTGKSKIVQNPLSISLMRSLLESDKKSGK